MKFEYQQDSLVLKVLDTSHTGEVLDFYKRNKDSFEKYETDKPSNFYTYTFIYNLLKAEYNACIHGKHIRFFLYDNSVSDKIIGSDVCVKIYMINISLILSVYYLHSTNSNVP